MTAGRSGRDLAYIVLMTLCLVLFVVAWAVVYRYSATAAIAMSVAALVIPPVAVIVANAGDEYGRHR